MAILRKKHKAQVVAAVTGSSGAVLALFAWRYSGLKRCGNAPANDCSRAEWTTVGSLVVVLAALLLTVCATIIFALINKRLLQAMQNTNQ